ncbi:MAG: D-aminoacyl-tRNA deacylase, partial [Planctomycetes bacterium]|nr:D-aminoacyl-tRNA deacylase [Planctomycetota bacterium]
MRLVIQRVSRASVEVEGHVAGAIGRGLLVLVGVEKGDTAAEAEFLARKVAALRIFGDEAGKMNLSVL